MRTSAFGRLSIGASPLGLRVTQFVAAIVVYFGLQASVAAVKFAMDYRAAQTWHELSAELMDVSENTSDPDQVRPWLSLRYQFQFDGQIHEGNQFTLAGSPYYLKPLLSETADQLAKSVRDHKPLPVFVDPGNPTNSVLNRDLLVTVLAVRIFAALAGLIGGAAMLAIATSELNRRRALDDRRSCFPEQPWRWRDDWTVGKIYSSSRIDSMILIAIAMVYLLVCMPLGLLVVKEHGQDIISVQGIVMMVIGWAAFNLARQRLWIYRKYDFGEFQLADQTGVTGGPLYGAVTLPYRFPKDQTLRTSIECVALERTIRKLSDRNQNIRETVLWRDSSLLQTTLDSPDPRKSLIPIYFAIPHQCRPSNPDGNPSIHWYLKVGPNGKEGPKQYAQFEVPVFETPDSSADFEADPEVMLSYEVPLRLESVMQRAGCQVRQLAGGNEEINFSNFRIVPFCAALLLITILTAGAVVIAFWTRPIWSIAPGIIAGIISLPLLHMTLWRGKLELGPDQSLASAGLLGFRKRVSLLPQAVHEIFTDVEYAMGDQSSYCLRLRTTMPEVLGELEPTAQIEDSQDEPDIDDPVFEELIIARGLSSQKEAMMLADWLAEKINAKVVGLTKH